MRKVFIFMSLCIVVLLGMKYNSTCKEKKSSLLLYNIEALASDDEHADVGRCVGTGSLDCPVLHIKVKYILGGYSLEME